MRKIIGGNGQDNTATFQAYVASYGMPMTKFLFLIGDFDDPNAIWATDYESPLLYLPAGTFLPATIKKSNLTFKVGLDPQTCTVTWSPSNRVFTNSISSSAPMQRALNHLFDNKIVRIWKAYMPTPGDCNTLGCAEWFAGVISSCKVGRAGVTFNVKGFGNLLTPKLPANVIEVTNTMSGYLATTKPPGDASIPIFQTFTGSTDTKIYGDCLSPTSGHVYDNGTFNGGYMVFLDGAGATLAGCWSAVGQSVKYTDGHDNEHNEFDLYSALPWPPTPGVDTFYVSISAPVDQTDGSFFGFPYVPNPETAA